VYVTFVPGNQPKTSSFWMPCQRHSSYADCAEELLKPSKDLASLLLGNKKYFFGWGLQIFCELHHKVK